MLFTILGTSSTNTVGGTVSSQAAQAQPPAMTSSRKGTFTDDLHKLVDNWARDAMNLSGRRGSKGHMNYEVSLNFPNLPDYQHTGESGTARAGTPSLQSPLQQTVDSI